MKFNKATLLLGAMGGASIGFIIWVFICYAI